MSNFYSNKEFNIAETKNGHMETNQNMQVDKLDPLQQLEMYIHNIQTLCNEVDKVNAY